MLELRVIKYFLLIPLYYILGGTYSSQSAAHSFSDNPKSYKCTRSLSDVLSQLNTQSHKIIFSDSLVKPWMRVLTSTITPSLSEKSLKDILQPYGLVMELGPKGSYLVARNKALPFASTLITGQVATRDTEEPISAGEVVVDSGNYTSIMDTKGCFLMVGIPEGDYKLSINHDMENYIDIDQTLHVVANQYLHISIKVERYKAFMVEELYVYGAKDSSLALKREASGLIDTIHEEEIRVLPNTTPAETLQRMSGITISRQNGEGRYVIVRGFGGDYNMVTLNGRVMPTSSLLFNGSGDLSSRAFDFSNIASESVSTIEVYKTSKATIATGGIGATINIISTRPLDSSGVTGSFGIKGVHDTTHIVGRDITPELSGQLGFVSDNQRYGLHLSASVQERNSAMSGAYVSFWDTQVYDGSLPQSPQLAESGEQVVITNEPDLGQLYSLPSDLRYTHADRKRKRANALLTLQARPFPSLTATMEYFYTKQEHYENRSELSIWMDSYKSHMLFDSQVVATPVLYWEERRERTPRDIGFALQQYSVKNENKSIGINVQWDAGDKLSFSLDAHNSSAQSLPNGSVGSWINIGMGVNAARGQGVDFSSDLPVLMLDFDDGLLSDNGVLDKSELGSSVRQFNIDQERTRIMQVQLEGAFVFNEDSRMDVGWELRRMDNHYKSSSQEAAFAGDWSIKNPGDIPSHYIEFIDYKKLFGQHSTELNQSFFQQASHGQALSFTQGFTGDAAIVGERLSSAIQLPWQLAPELDVNRQITENIQAAYLQFNMLSELGQRPINIQAGVRYEATNLTSTSTVLVPMQVQWIRNSDLIFVRNSFPQLFIDDSHYENILPSFDFSIDIVRDVKARLSYSKTISRAPYRYLKAAVDSVNKPHISNSTNTKFIGTASAGNPGLLPLISNNIDVVAEWYFAPNSYVSLGFFEKKVIHFVGVETSDQSVYGLTDPSIGVRAIEATDTLNAEQIPVNNTTLFNMIAANQLGVNYHSMTSEMFEDSVDIIADDSDPLMEFRVNYPVNNESAKIHGFELSVQHFLNNSDLGVKANYIAVSGDVDFDITADPSELQFGLPDLSDSANLVLVYDKANLHGRLGYHWRAAFLNKNWAGTNEPSFTEEYTQIDFKVSYKIFNNLDIFVEGFNITGEDVRHYGRTTAQLNWYEVLGPRYQLGIYYSF